MSRPTQLLLSQLIAPDAPLLSPVSSPVDAGQGPIFDGFALHYAAATEHPTDLGAHDPVGLPTLRPEPTTQPLCLPTHQVFDLAPEAFSPPPVDDDEPLDVPVAAAGGKRQAAPGEDAGAAPSKKPRAEGRITTREFVPPDVSGLSKREARLVKNRAAAFLSRQRKREEFEQMEIRVAELEQENARLRAGAAPAPRPPAEDDLREEVEALRAQLAAATQREGELVAKLVLSGPGVKLEQIEPELPASRSPSPALPTQGTRSAASLGLMVLLCALPTLLSVQAGGHSHSHGSGSALPGRFSFPLAPGSAHADAFSAFVPNSFADFDLDLPLPSMDVDLPLAPGAGGAGLGAGLGLGLGSLGPLRRLEFAGADGADVSALGLGDLDISFDAAPAEDGKIRVRIHHPAAAAAASAPASQLGRVSSPAPSSWLGSPPPSTADLSDPLGPFLGVGAGADDDMGMSIGSPFLGSSDPGDFDGLGLASGFGAAGAAAGAGPAGSKPGRRRVRIALKSMPRPGGEGGEWEVEVC